jgi:hypothetical protein
VRPSRAPRRRGLLHRVTRLRRAKKGAEFAHDAHPRARRLVILGAAPPFLDFLHTQGRSSGEETCQGPASASSVEAGQNMLLESDDAHVAFARAAGAEAVSFRTPWLGESERPLASGRGNAIRSPPNAFLTPPVNRQNPKNVAK